MVAALNRLPGLESEIATTDADGANGRIRLADLPSDVPIRLFRRTWSEQWKVSLDLKSWLARHAKDYAVVHIHAVWSHATVTAAAAARRNSVPYIVRPAGMLSEWALGHRGWKKQLAWQLNHKRQLAAASAIHATSSQEAADIRGMNLSAPVAVIPNGVAFPEAVSSEGDRRPRKRLLFLGRIHPVKGLANLLHAWQQLGPLKGWELVLVGPDDVGHRAELERLATELKIADRVQFIGAASEQDKWQWYQTSDLFVLPSFTENFSVSVAEALAAGLPVITTTGTPWQEVQEQGCGWWIEPTVDALTKTLLKATSITDHERRAMGRRGSDWAQSRFSWLAVAEDLRTLYRWVIEGGSAPDYVLQ
jgi:glycosyltransferase involved in cell wall biosynthesis